ncbi:hypothetical protein CDAR_305281 [Caerostris darwini]|uniref:Uncharacterized protein n=1 Tax=Caerostris darwini TaxID=1538125 RepID=A0AAV4MAW7_9ARAC|nr:hypothetical protein CDAR_305281 [Caerostris darwini]
MPIYHLATTVAFTTTAQNDTMNISSVSPTDNDFLQIHYIIILIILSGLNRVKYLNQEKTALFHKKDGVLRLKAKADELLKQVHDKYNQFGIKILKIQNFNELDATSARAVHNKLKRKKGVYRKHQHSMYQNSDPTNFKKKCPLQLLLCIAEMDYLRFHKKCYDFMLRKETLYYIAN